MMDIKKITIDAVKKIYEDLGGEIEEVNLFGIRNELNQDSDLYNDFIGIFTGEIVRVYEGTTDPGSWWTLHPVTVEGVTGAAHLCDGFHSKAWRVGIHAQGTAFAHEALVQTGNSVKVWRDVDGDYVKDDSDKIQRGYYGINIHRGAIDSPKTIGRYSAGCQVIRQYKDFLEFMKLIKGSDNYRERKSAARFSYLLVNINQL